MKAGLAEFIGTFTLTFIGAATGAQAAAAGGLVAVALAHGLALMVIIYAWGKHSGAHVNPAVTLGLAVTGRIDFGKAVCYWIAQFAGAVAAAYLLKFLIGISGNLGWTVGSLTEQGDSVRVILVEAVLTFFLVSAVYASGVLGHNGNLAGVAIGLVLTMDILAGGNLTGASMNPARSFGPFLAMGELKYLWMYVVGPAIGGVAAALLYHGVFADDAR
jgi:MIP family channel proteins